MERMSKRAAIYCRVSTDKQEDKYSLPDQLENTRNHCKERGYKVVVEFREVHSGYELDERPDLNELRAMMAHGLIDVVVVNELDRLSRKQLHTAVIMYQAEKYQVAVEAVLGPRWEDDPMGQHVLSTMALLAEMERAAIRDRTMRGKKQRVRQGKPLGFGKAPYGFVWGGERNECLEPDDRTIPVLRQMCDLILAQKSAREISRQFTARGILTPRDQWVVDRGGTVEHPHAWTPTTITRILENPIYTGDYVAFRFRHFKRRDHDHATGDVRTVHTKELRAEDDPERVVLRGLVPQIIPPEIIKIVRKQLEVNKMAAARNNKHPEGTLLRGGFAVCGLCGTTMGQCNVRAKKGEALYFSYKCAGNWRIGASSCSTTVGATRLDRVVWAGIEHVMRNLRDYEIQLQSRTASAAPANDAVEALEKGLQKATNRKAALKKSLQYLEDDETIAQVSDDINHLSREIRKLEQGLEEAKGASGEQQDRLERLRDLELLIAAHLEKLSDMPYAGKRMLLRIMGIRVTIYPNGHEPRYSIDTYPEFHERFFAAAIFHQSSHASEDVNCVTPLQSGCTA
jgi:site-specific DNA recombinase